MVKQHIRHRGEYTGTDDWLPGITNEGPLLRVRQGVRSESEKLRPAKYLRQAVLLHYDAEY